MVGQVEGAADAVAAAEFALCLGDSDARLLEFADGDGVAHPLPASTSTAPAQAQAMRRVLPPQSTTRAA